MPLLQDDIEKMISKLEERIQNLEEGSCLDAIILPLHGSLPPEMQASLALLQMWFLFVLYSYRKEHFDFLMLFRC